ncbi:MAG: insulinase family protein, partial [Gemmatimonadetes bacterium]|nr:insulinase family protein [Gemmatimonadota bacterium]
RHYGDMAPGEPLVEPAPEEPPRRGFRLRELAGDIARTHVQWGWRTPGTLDPDTPALDLLAVVLGQGRASRLYRGVRERGVVHNIQASNYTPTELGVFGIGAELDAEQARAALEAIWSEVARVAAAGIGAEELGRAQNMLEAWVLRRTETVEGQANLLAEWQALGDWRLAEQYLDRLMSARAHEVQRVAQDYLALDLATVLVYRPEAAPGLGLSAESLEQALRGARASASALAPAAVSPSGRCGDAAHQRASPGPPQPPPAPQRDRQERSAASAPSARASEDGVFLYDLPNGVRIAIKPRRSSPLVSMGVACRGGALHETEETAGVTALMARASIKGTENRTAAQLAEATEALGGAIAPATSSDAFEWSLTLPSRHFERGFELLADAALHATFPDAEVERERAILLSDLQQLRDDMVRYPLHLCLQGAFRGHPYGFAIGTTEAALSRLGADDLRRWHEARVRRGQPLVVIVGDVAPETAGAIVARELGGLAVLPALDGAPMPVWPSGRREESERRGKAQTALVLGFPGVGRNDPDVYPLQVLSNIVSGLGGRLFEELRSRRSLAYTVTAYPIARWLGGAFVAYIATSPEREEEARRGLLEQLARLAEDVVAPDELERAQRYTIGAWQIRGQTNGAQLHDLVNALLLGRGLAELREFPARIRAVTPGAIREAVARSFDPGRLVEGIVRGAGGARQELVARS